MTTPPSEPFDSALIQPYVDDFVIGKLRRREEQARLIAEYEAEHGVITQAEIDALQNAPTPESAS